MQSERLWARPVDSSDLHRLHELHSDPRVMHFIRPPEQTVGDTEVTLDRILKFMAANPGYGNFAAFRRDDQEFIGWFLLKELEDSGQVELGYRLHQRFWGQGYATEMARPMIEYARKELKLEELVAITHPLNLASQNVLKKLGFKYVRDDNFYDTDVKFYQLNLDEQVRK